MKIAARCSWLIAGFLFLSPGTLHSQSAELIQSRRTPWTTSNITGSPEEPPPYQLENLFPKLKFKEPVDLALAPGSDRLYVLELSGKLYSFPSSPEVAEPELILDLKQIPGAREAYGFTFHPGFATNRFIYICYVLQPDLPEGTRVSRFLLPDATPEKIDPSSEEIIITWLSGGHNGGCLKFGPDTFLYISTGDAAGPNPPDPLRAGQDVSNLLSAILRIDVDQRAQGANYRVPEDNPFVSLAGARPEIWAYGFRNPWKMSFDRKTGDLWVGDVGWELWELIYNVVRGGNYGWSIVEGRQPIHPAEKQGPTPILPPTVDHPHSEAASITGGHVYYSQRLPGLDGIYLYGDWETGKLWGLRYENESVTWNELLAETHARIISFAEDEAGEVYVMSYEGEIYQLTPSPESKSKRDFPRTLSDSGLFSDTSTHQVAPGVVPYSINSELWSDGAVAERFLGIPGDGRIDPTKERWVYPEDTVLGKTFSLELEPGDPESRRRIETQILHFDGRVWRGYAYLWNEDQSDAALVEAQGTERTLSLRDPESKEFSRHLWRVSSRSDCLRCHNTWSGPPLALNLEQLNKETTPASSENQLRAWVRAGIFSEPFKDNPWPQLANHRDPRANLNDRARSYLHVNCAHCHRLHAGGSVPTILNHDVPLEKTVTIGARPALGQFGIDHAAVIAPGDPFRSVLFYRLSKMGGGRMPHIGSSVVDVEGLDLIYNWISSLPHEKEKLKPPAISFSAADDEDAFIAASLNTTENALALTRLLDEKILADASARKVIEQGASHPTGPIRDLFERFIPEERRVRKVGPRIAPREILALTGDPARGRGLFFQESLQCQSCHQINGTGRNFGPDLSRIGSKLDRAQLLQSMADPSLEIAPEYAGYQIETADGRLHSGFLLKKSASEWILKTLIEEEIRIAADEIIDVTHQQTSIMPEALLQDLTAQEVADLIAFLSGLK